MERWCITGSCTGLLSQTWPQGLNLRQSWWAAGRTWRRHYQDLALPRTWTISKKSWVMLYMLVILWVWSYKLLIEVTKNWLKLWWIDWSYQELTEVMRNWLKSRTDWSHKEPTLLLHLVIFPLIGPVLYKVTSNKVSCHLKVVMQVYKKFVHVHVQYGFSITANENIP